MRDFVKAGKSDLGIELTQNNELKMVFPETGETLFQLYLILDGEPVIVDDLEQLNIFFPTFPMLGVNSNLGAFKLEIEDENLIVTTFIKYRLQGNQLIPSEDSDLDFESIPLSLVFDPNSDEGDQMKNSNISWSSTDEKSLKNKTAKRLYSKINQYHPLIAEHTKYILVGYLLLSLELLDSEEKHNNSERNLSYHDYIVNTTRNSLRSKF